jgi:hypothetical protein
VQSIRFSWLAAIVVLPLFLLPVRADASEAPWYQFEVIIFERLDQRAGSTELWPVDPGTPSRLDALPVRLTPGRGKADSPNPVPYTALPRSAWQIGELTQRLRRSRNYRPHVHLAWRQQVVDPDHAQLLYIEMMDKRDARHRIDGQPKLEGTLKVGVKRYLHFETDLLIRRLKRSGSESSQSEVQSYRLQTTRRMRSGKLHYLDHPVFGVLVKASRYEPPPPPKPEPPAPVVSEQPLPRSSTAQPASTPGATTPPPAASVEEKPD